MNPTPAANPTAAQAQAELLATAVSLHQSGHAFEAEHAYRRILAANPDHADALHLLGLIQHQYGRTDEAVALIGRAIEVDGGQAVYHANLGKILKAAGRIEDALAAFQTAAAIAPDDRETRWNLGEAFLQLQRYRELVDAFSIIVARDAEHMEAHAYLGVALLRLNQPAEALLSFEAALRLAPDHGPSHANIASALGLLGRLDESVEANREAIRLAPDHVAAYTNQGLNLQQLSRYEEAVAAYEQAIVLDPNNSGARFGLATARLRLGDWAAAWPDFEWRWGVIKNARPFTGPQWRGEDLTGRTILLDDEQGVGDAIQFCRYAAPLSALGARVVLETRGAMIRLLSQVEGIDQFAPRGEPLPPYDYHCPLMSLPGVFGATLETVPSKPAYLKPEPELVTRWRERIGSSGFRVGIFWQGNPTAAAEKGRSAPLAAFAPLAMVPGVRLISLQKGYGVEQLDDMPAGMRVETLGEYFDIGPDAFIDTAAVMANLDLVITVDSAAGHLAGALGRPVWIALQRAPHWVWTAKGETSPWYPSARLFRQTERADWGGVFKRIAEALRGKVRHSSAP